MTHTVRSNITNAIALLVCGLGIGWLLGLATTPVLNIVLSSVIAALAAVAVVLMRLSKERAKESSVTASQPAPEIGGATAIPLALIVFGLAVGTPLGLAAREYRWFTPPPVEATEAADNASSRTSLAATAPGLYDSPIFRSECEEVKDRVDDPSLLPQLMRQGNPTFRAAAELTQDPEALRVVVRVLCDPTLWPRPGERGASLP